MSASQLCLVFIFCRLQLHNSWAAFIYYLLFLFIFGYGSDPILLLIMFFLFFLLGQCSSKNSKKPKAPSFQIGSGWHLARLSLWDWIGQKHGLIVLQINTGVYINWRTWFLMTLCFQDGGHDIHLPVAAAYAAESASCLLSACDVIVSLNVLQLLIHSIFVLVSLYFINFFCFDHMQWTKLATHHFISLCSMLLYCAMDGMEILDVVYVSSRHLLLYALFKWCKICRIKNRRV